MPNPSNHSEPPNMTRRDGAGLVVADEDLRMRALAQTELAVQISRRVAYEGTVRSGRFVYRDGAVRIAFDQELAAGDCKALVFIPSAEHWAATTGTSLDERDEIVRFVAEAAACHVGGRSVVSEAFIEIYSFR